jgi:serine/threonine protein kinase
VRHGASQLRQGSQDNLTVQIIRLDQVPDRQASEVFGQSTELPLPPLLEARMIFDGYRIVREIHGSSRSHIYLAVDIETDDVVAIKIPSIDLRDDPVYLKRFMMEEWVARRIDSPHVLKSCSHARTHNYLYVATEFIDGQTLAQWMIDNPKPDLETVRGIVEQVARGLRAFHRKEMLHQDIRPENIMIDKTGTAKIIDFGSTKIAGAKARTRSQFSKLRYDTVPSDNSEIPVWVDGALRKAVHPDPYKRYDSLSEYMFDLRHPNANYVATSATPLIERNPLLFWKFTTVILACAIVVLLAIHHGTR